MLEKFTKKEVDCYLGDHSRYVAKIKLQGTKMGILSWT